MNIKLLDMEQARRIYQKHYADEFSFPDFAKHYMVKFSVVDNKDNVIIVGGVRALPEIILMTDKDADIMDRRTALLAALDFSIYNMQQLEHDSLHAYTKDQKWSKHLKRSGFRPIQGEGLILEI